MEKMPLTLYRGVVINYNQLKDFKFYDVDLEPYEAPIIDEHGRKMRSDGNEYGIYLTDNLSMVHSAYGNVHQNGTPLSHKISIGKYHTPIYIPNIGICYQIQTDGLNIKQPQISSIWMGHYNNGFEGHEYITSSIPKENIIITRIQIGGDYLHEEEFVDTKDIKATDKIVRQTMEERKQRLEDLLKALELLSPLKRQALGEREQILFRDIFGKNGVKYLSEDKIDITNASGALTQLLFNCYHNAPDNMDFKKLLYIEQLKKRIKSSSINDLLELVSEDINNNQAKKEAFIKRKQQEDETPNTIGFDTSDTMFKEILNQIISLQKKQEQNKQSQKEATLKKIEQILQFRVSPIKEYLVDPNRFGGIPFASYKSAEELLQERVQVFQKIDELHTSGVIDLGTANAMKRVLIEEYEKMAKNASTLASENVASSSPKAK